MDTAPVDHDLATALLALYREIGGLHGAVSRRLGLTTQQALLLCLVGHGRPSLGELAGSLGCDKTNVTGLVDRLERRELLRREIEPQDRRVSRVILTEQGHAIGAQLRTAFAEAVTERLGSWPTTRRHPFAQLAQAAAEAFSQQ